MILRCSRCKESKPDSEFSYCAAKPSLRQSNCRGCERELSLALYHAKGRDKEQKAAYDRMRRAKLREELSAYEKQRAQLPHRKEQAKQRGRVRKAGIGFATPSWLTDAQRGRIKQLYKLAQKFELLFGRRYHVDHIVPLRGKNVCGLHVPWNLRITEAELNQRKSNKVQLNRKAYP